MIYTIGETVLDIILKNMKPRAVKAGGSALNTAVSLAQLGSSVRFISEIGNDESGTFILDFLSQNNLDCTYVQTHVSCKTPLAMAFLNEQNDATYQFYKELPDTVHFPRIPMNKHDIVLFSSSYAIAQRNRAALISILHAAQINKSVCLYDPNMRKPLSRSGVEYDFFCENLSYASIVRASDEDCMNIFGTNNGADVFRKLSKYGVSVLVLTQNKSDVEVYTPRFVSSYEVPEIIPISTIGAGDTFNAGIIHCLQYGKNQDYLSRTFWDTAIPFAISCSAVVCRSYENYVTSADVINLKSLF